MDPQLDDFTMEGDRALLNGTRRALLISRTNRRPAPGTRWVRAVVEATHRSVERDEAIVLGVGRDPYDLALRTAQNRRGKAIVIVDEPLDRSAWWRDLLPERYLLLQLPPPPSLNGEPPLRARPEPARLRRRDMLIAQLADCAWEIAVRRNGIMAMLLYILRERGCAIDASFRFPRALTDVRVASADLRSGAASPRVFSEWPYLTHYTREPDGAWPGETRCAYLDWLADGPLDARRDAAAALERILEEGCLRASGRLMPDREPMVSWTAAPPQALAQLRRWRASLHRWDFRPYAIAVRRDVLERLGARPVRYLPGAELKKLPPAERLFAQKHEPPATDWSAEMEWRTRGDLRLGDLPRDAVRLLLPTADEAERCAGRVGYMTLAIAP